jgi:hypothetical protein
MPWNSSQLEAHADAFFLDGFSPACNPDLWSPAVFAQLARLAAPGASLATWSVTGHVRRGLEAAGFTLERRAGFGGKREMLAGRSTAGSAPPAPPAERTALVIGAGVAGTSVAERLAARGWRVSIIDEADGPGQGASGNRAGVFRPCPASTTTAWPASPGRASSMDGVISMPWPTPATPCAGHPPACCTWAATPNRKESRRPWWMPTSPRRLPALRRPG